MRKRIIMNKNLKKFAYKLNNSQGVTLLELVVALALLALVISPFYAHFLQSIKIELYAKDLIKGEYIAQQILESEKQKAGSFVDDAASDSSFTKDITVVRSELELLAKNGIKTYEYTRADGRFVKLTYESKSNDQSLDHTTLYGNPSTNFICKPIVNNNGDVFLKFENKDPLLLIGSDKPFKPSVKLINDAGSNDYNAYFSNVNDTSWTALSDKWDLAYNFSYTNSNVGTNGEKDTQISMLFDCSELENLPSGEDNIVELYVSTNMLSEYNNESKKFNIYEIDPLNRFEIVTNLEENSGVVEIYRGLDKDSYAQIVSGGQYYWVTVQVYSSKDAGRRRLAELYSSIRKK